jgi:hypothetical protein
MTLRLFLALLLLPVALLGFACGGDDDDAGGDEDSDATSTSTSTATEEVDTDDESVFDLEVGDCFNDVSADSASEVPLVDCSDPHDNEIYFEYEIDGDGDFPGEDVILDEAADTCIPEFESFVGSSYETTALEVFPIYPTVESWADGDRIVYCALYAKDASKLTGSAEGTAQ